MNESDLFMAALQIDAAERAAYLDRACANEAVLRQRLEALLVAFEQAGSFLQQPAADPQATSDLSHRGISSGSDPAEEAGTVIGLYKLLEQIGEGGMGTVWMAQQTEPVKRLVAVKLIKAGMDSKQVLARFESERQALALMEHPNIAKVLDAGKTPSGRPYFVMELVKGQPITKYCDEKRLPVRERLELFGDVCRAVQHAHQKGIIHRDLKPSNVLVAPYDGKPVVKVIDFGVAKATGQRLTDKTLFTGFGALVGTPQYMSPEQAEVNNQDIDTRSDIYALGVLLYELLTGSPPFTGKDLEKVGMLEILRVIREQEPSKPSTKLSTAEGLPTLAANRGTEPGKLMRLVRGELDWIVMKALEKDRSRRYETANGFALDVQRYLADEAVLACPPSAWYRLRKFARRNKARIAVVAGASLAVMLTATTIGWAVRDRAAREREIERQEEKRREGVAQQASRALAEAQDLCRADRLPEAKAAVQRAEELLADGGDELRGRLDQVRHDVEMAGRVEETRLQRAAVKDGNFFDNAGADRAYGEAFRDYGLDVAALAPDQAAERIRASAIREQLVAALDDWLHVKALADATTDERLLAVLQRVDADSWRRQLRDAFRRRDKKTLQALVGGPKALRQRPATLVLLGHALTKVGERPLAIVLLRSAQQQYPNDFWINQNLALALMESRPAEPGLAVGYYRAALALRPESPGVCFNLGNALKANGELAEAVAAYQRAIALKPDYVQAHIGLGNALSDKGQMDEAIAAYREALRLKKDNVLAHNGLGNALSDKGQLDEAIAEYREAIRLKKDDAPAHNGLGNALLTKGQLDEAIAAYREALRLKKDDARVRNNLGNALSDKGQLGEAIAEYHEALRLKKDDALVHNNLGSALHRKGQMDEAIAAYREALRLKKDFAKAHYNLGNALRAKGQLDEAIAEYREAIRIKKDYAEAHCNLGLALHDKGQDDEAIAAYREAIRLKKDLPEPHNNLAFALHRRGRLDEAIAAYREAIRIKEDYPEAHVNLGIALRQKGQYCEALKEVRRGHELGSRNPGWRDPSAEWVRQLERLVELDGRLPGILKRKTAPVSPRDGVELAGICSLKQLNRAAARLYEGAFAADPKLLDDLSAAHRYNAACAAALASCGQGKDADKLDGKERARLRQQALDWLRADLEGWRRLLDRGPDNDRPMIVEKMRQWLADTDLTGVRGAAALARLPEAERPAWQKLWHDVADTLARVQTRAPPEKKSDAK
jgi:serine/threonine protein kinase/tetratricopeptide (TPR) repeat protein